MITEDKVTELFCMAGRNTDFGRHDFTLFLLKVKVIIESPVMSHDGIAEQRGQRPEETFYHQTSNEGMRFARRCISLVAWYAIDILNILLELGTFLPLIMIQTNDIPQISHTEFTRKSFCKLSHPTAMCVIVLKGLNSTIHSPTNMRDIFIVILHVCKYSYNQS